MRRVSKKWPIYYGFFLRIIFLARSYPQKVSCTTISENDIHLNCKIFTKLTKEIEDLGNAYLDGAYLSEICFLEENKWLP